MQLLRILALASLAVMAIEISTVAALGFDKINRHSTSAEESRAATDAAFLVPVSGPAVAPKPPVPEYLAPGAPTTIGGAEDPSAAPAASSAPAAAASAKPAAASAKPAVASAKPAAASAKSAAASAKPAAASAKATPSVAPAAKATATTKTKKRSMDDEEDAVDSAPAVERSMDDELLEAADADDN